MVDTDQKALGCDLRQGRPNPSVSTGTMDELLAWSE